MNYWQISYFVHTLGFEKLSSLDQQSFQDVKGNVARNPFQNSAVQIESIVDDHFPTLNEILSEKYVVINFSIDFYVSREEIEKQRAHERYLRLQEQGKTDQARKDLGNHHIRESYQLLMFL